MTDGPTPERRPNEPKKDEPEKESAKATLRLLARPDIPSDLRRLIVQDHVYKCANIGDTAHARDMEYAGLRLYTEKDARLPGSSASFAFEDKVEFVQTRKSIDVVIVTTLTQEARAMKKALAIDAQRARDDVLNGMELWQTDFVQDNGRHLSVMVARTADRGPTECAAACGAILAHYIPGCLLLVGIAAGIKGLLNLGDAVVSQRVLDYEGRRAASDGDKKRPQYYEPPKRILRNLDKVLDDEAKPLWRDLLSVCIQGLRDTRGVELPGSLEDNVDESDWEDGIIASGYALLANGSLPSFQDEYHDKVRAAETEASGFAATCREQGIPWLVFRGISDFGGPDDSRTRRLWRLRAALAAAAAAAVFLRLAYEPANEEDLF